MTSKQFNILREYSECCYFNTPEHYLTRRPGMNIMIMRGEAKLGKGRERGGPGKNLA